MEGEEASTLCAFTDSIEDANPGMINTSVSSSIAEVVDAKGTEDPAPSPYIEPRAIIDNVSTVGGTDETVIVSEIQVFRNDEAEREMKAYSSLVVPDDTRYTDDESETISSISGTEDTLVDSCHVDEASPTTSVGVEENIEMKLDSVMEPPGGNETSQDASVASQNLKEIANLCAPSKEKVLSLLNEAVGSGSVLILDDSLLDADIIYQRAVDLAKSAPPGPVFKHQSIEGSVQKKRKKKLVVTKQKQEAMELEVKEITVYDMQRNLDEKKASAKKGREKKDSKVQKTRTRDFDEPLDSIVPQGSLRVDELAKLLA